jgi:hypothetical protein
VFVYTCLGRIFVKDVETEIAQEMKLSVFFDVFVNTVLQVRVTVNRNV